CQRFDIVPAARSKRLAVGSTDGSDYCIRDAVGSAITIDNTAAHPRSVIGCRDKSAAIWFHEESGDAAECFMLRGEDKPSPKFQTTKAGLRGILTVECRYWRCLNLNARRLVRVPQRIGASIVRDGRSQCDKERTRNRPTAVETRQATRLRARGAGRSLAACSSNSSASFSV